MFLKLYDRLGSMQIDEEGTKSLGSDHKRIKITFGASVPKQQAQGRAGKPKLTDAQIQKKYLKVLRT